MSPVNLGSCTEELLKLTLQCRTSETLEFDLGLSKDFCSLLLKLDPSHDPFPASHSTGNFTLLPFVSRENTKINT
ncbi:hypothetical protein TIFTF001_033313 [Ficus carica]|uniref:Uncharacterized protein n=1 Tax=Ficus carica TaxID=3494 RepID=A0AA88J7Q2_FICCA|nr:hypothetical protein TIFTF001_033313 [Ficus carica]